MELNLNGIYALFGPNKERFSLGAFAGKLSIAIFMQGNKQPFKFSLSPVVLDALIRVLKKALTMGPGQAGIIMQKKYDESSKTFYDDAYIAVGRDDKNIIYIEVKASSMSSAVRFPFSMPKALQFGSEQMDNKTRSEFEVQSFLDVIVPQLNTSILLSRNKADMEKYGPGAKYNKSSNIGSPSPGDDLF